MTRVDSPRIPACENKEDDYNNIRTLSGGNFHNGETIMAETRVEESGVVPESKQSKAKPVFFGCGLGCLAIIVLFIIFSFLAVRWEVRHMKDLTADFEKRGFTVLRAPSPEKPLDITEKVTRPTLYIGQEVTLIHGADAEIAIMAARASLHGTFKDKVYYRGGGELSVAADAELLKGLDAQARKIDLAGSVRGEITGRIDELGKTAATQNATGSLPSP
jgi:hypothetical protein